MKNLDKLKRIEEIKQEIIAINEILERKNSIADVKAFRLKPDPGKSPRRILNKFDICIMSKEKYYKHLRQIENELQELYSELIPILSGLDYEERIYIHRRYISLWGINEIVNLLFGKEALIGESLKKLEEIKKSAYGKLRG